MLAELHIPVKMGKYCDNCADRFTCFTNNGLVIVADNQIENINSSVIIDLEAEFIINKTCAKNVDVCNIVFLHENPVYVTEYTIHGFPIGKIHIKSKIPSYDFWDLSK